MKYPTISVVGLSMLLGCHGDKIVYANPSTVSVTGSISRTAIRAGDTTSLFVTITNVTSGEIQFNGNCVQVFGIFRDSLDLTVLRGACSSNLSILIVRLAPRESHTFHVVFNGRLGTQLLAPGSYKLQPRLRMTEPYPDEAFAFGLLLPLEILPD